MKRVLMFLLLVFTFGMVMASVDVHNYSVGKSYALYSNITGEINMTIVGEDYDALITSNDDDEIKLGDFLNASGNLFTCSPPDCSKDYSSSSGATDKNFSVSSSGEVFVGFVITGEDVEVGDLSFDLESNFGVSSQRPLSINFFEREDWEFSEFSTEFLQKDWGCYNLASASVGPSIGDILYCEMIRIPDTGLIKVGAAVTDSDNYDLDMTVYPETGTGGDWTCSYNPGSSDGCVISPEKDEIFSAGNYQVCVSADNFTNYKINKEISGDTCGFAYASGPDNSTKDYAIYAQGVKYASASVINSDDFSNEDFVVAANDLISERYGGDCSDGCVLPLKIKGVSQNVRIHNVLLTFDHGSELGSVNNVYNLNAAPVTVDFDGVLDLISLGFDVSKAMKYSVYLDSTKLFSETISVIPAPIISFVLPLEAPAGVPVRFYASVNYTSNASLTYTWKFGNSSNKITNVPYTEYAFPALGNYTLSLKVSAGGNLTSTKTFGISVISPKEAVNSSLISRRKALNNTISIIAGFPSWYGTPLSTLININFFKSELDRLSTKNLNAFSDSDFIKVAIDLYALDVPAGININSFESPYMITEPDDIDIEPVAIIGGAVSGASNDDYANPILNWQNVNIDASFSSSTFYVSNYSGGEGAIFTTYAFNVSSADNHESYFVINRPFNELYFKENVGARTAGDATVIIIPSDGKKVFEFYYKSGDSTTFFVSPKLSSIVIEADIDTTCNYNLVCEEENGEDYKTCRSDCKPVAGAILYVILSLIFLLIVYSILQVWYKHRYENFLFNDRRQLYNLLMYVTNARARGMGDNRIAAELRSQGWSSERINYIIKKSRGQRTGLYEIIPFSKISAFFRNRKAEKAQAARVVTGVQQQNKRNINKSEFRM